MQVKIYDELPLEAKKIREDVFVKEQGFNEEFDIIDKTAKHILISENNIHVATCRIFYSKERNSYIIGRIAVCKQYRGKKYGVRLLEYAEREIKKSGGTTAELSAQCRVSEFYSIVTSNPHRKTIYRNIITSCRRRNNHIEYKTLYRKLNSKNSLYFMIFLMWQPILIILNFTFTDYSQLQ